MSPEVSGIDIIQPARVCKISINDVLRIDEEVLSCAGDTRVLISERGNKDSRLAVVVELPMKRALWTNSSLVQADGSVNWQVCVMSIAVVRSGRNNLTEAIFKNEARHERSTTNERDYLSCTIVQMNAVKTTRI